MTHKEYAKRARVSTSCTASHVNYGGGCLNCGWSPHQEQDRRMWELAKEVRIAFEQSQSLKGELKP